MEDLLWLALFALESVPWATVFLVLLPVSLFLAWLSQKLDSIDRGVRALSTEMWDLRDMLDNVVTEVDELLLAEIDAENDQDIDEMQGLDQP